MTILLRWAKLQSLDRCCSASEKPADDAHVRHEEAGDPDNRADGRETETHNDPFGRAAIREEHEWNREHERHGRDAGPDVGIQAPSARMRCGDEGQPEHGRTNGHADATRPPHVPVFSRHRWFGRHDGARSRNGRILPDVTRPDGVFWLTCLGCARENGRYGTVRASR